METIGIIGGGNMAEAIIKGIISSGMYKPRDIMASDIRSERLDFLAKEYKIGHRLTEIIQEHHGTSIVSYFYSKAKEQEDPALHVIEETDFRYPGPKPQTKEAGIIMLADAVEAASRTLEDPTPKRIENHVQQIVEKIFVDGQLDECELTLKDLHAIQKSFITILIGIFHQRIEYPERTQNGGTDKKLPKIDEARSKGDRKGDKKPAHLFKASG